MPQPDLIHFAVSDFTALLRGRAFPAADLPRYLAHGCGWVPANQAVTAFDTAAPCPAGSVGDLRLVADPATRTTIDLGADRPGLTFFLCDTHTPESLPWDACARSFLKAAVQALEEQTGTTLQVGLEHEFSLVDPAQGAAPAFSLRRMARHGRFIAAVTTALEQAGVPPEMVLAEYGPTQFEITLPPAPPLLAADRAVVLREVVRLTAEAHGLHASFAPKLSPEVVGNGVHAHLGLLDADGRPAMFEAEAPGWLSAAAQSFCAGILRELPDCLALTAASPPSYIRLRPHGWSVAANCVGLRCREASLRVVPAPTPQHDPAACHHVEFRGADATASPYVMLGALIRAGLGGLADRLPLERVFTEDLSELSADELRERGIAPLPQTLTEALDRLAASERVQSWAGPLFWAYYQAHKRAEVADVADLGEAETCLRYARVY
jgi:glutamine synthetase